MRSGKKGVSEVVAAMMLITITVAASLIVYVYSSGLLGSLQAAQPAQGQYANQLTLEFYDWTNLGTLSLTLRNVGSGLGIIAAFYVNGRGVTMKGGSTCTTTTALQPQASCSASLDTSKLSLSAGVAFIVKVTTKDGGIFSFSCIAGQRTGSAS